MWRWPISWSTIKQTWRFVILDLLINSLPMMKCLPNVAELQQHGLLRSLLNKSTEWCQTGGLLVSFCINSCARELHLNYQKWKTQTNCRKKNGLTNRVESTTIELSIWKLNGIKKPVIILLILKTWLKDFSTETKTLVSALRMTPSKSLNTMYSIQISFKMLLKGTTTLISSQTYSTLTKTSTSMFTKRKFKKQWTASTTTICKRSEKRTISSKMNSSAWPSKPRIENEKIRFNIENLIIN